MIFKSFESIFCCLVWSLSIFYSMYKVSLLRKHFDGYEDNYGDFTEGWSWLKRRKDVADEEWSTWIPFMFETIPWIIVHIIGGKLVKSHFKNSTVLCCWYLCISVIFLLFYVGIFGTICLFIQPCVSSSITIFRKKYIPWIVHMSFLVIIYAMKNNEITMKEVMHLDETRYYMLTIAICYIQIRSISYSHESPLIREFVSFEQFFTDLLQNAAYCLYLPTLFLGPIILYDEFLDGIKLPMQNQLEKFKIFSLNMIRFAFWLFFTELALHFLYFNAMHYHPDMVRQFDGWELYGFGYCMGQYFLNKYVVVFGICGEISRFEDISAPLTPKCIGRIHLYSDMWKYFDRGLYKFLVRYIYSPVRRLNLPLKKFIASFLCFSFVYVWHGMQMFIFIWALFNFIGVTIEAIAKSINAKIAPYRENLSPWTNRRINCAIATPLLAMSAVSNFYFFAGEEIGHIFVYRTINAHWKEFSVLMFALYCCCNVSTDAKAADLKKASLKIN